MRTIAVDVVKSALLDIQDLLADQSLPPANRVDIARLRISRLATQIEQQADYTHPSEPSPEGV